MYGLPINLDLKFFNEKELLQVCIGLNDMIINFEGSIGVSITSKCVYECAGEVLEIENYVLSANILCSLLGKKVTEAVNEDGKNLKLRFEGDCSLNIFDDSEHYESYVIIGAPEGEIIV